MGPAEDDLRVGQAISDKKYRPADQLPSENQLAAQHRATRPTIRRALQDLRLKGLIKTRQGKGAFVRMPSPIAITLTADNYHRHRQQGRPGFAAQMDEQGHTSRQDILAGVPVTRNIRTAYAGDQPVEVMDTISHGEVVSYRFEIEV